MTFEVYLIEHGVLAVANREDTELKDWECTKYQMPSHLSLST